MACETWLRENRWLGETVSPWVLRGGADFDLDVCVGVVCGGACVCCVWGGVGGMVLCALPSAMWFFAFYKICISRVVTFIPPDPIAHIGLV